MAAKSRGVGHDDVVTNRAVVSDVGVSHDEVVAAYAGEASAFDGAAVDGDELANDIVVADFETRGLALIADILWRQTYGGKRKELIMAADLRGAVYGDVRDQLAGFAEFDVCTDGAVRADLAGWMNFRS